MILSGHREAVAAFVAARIRDMQGPPRSDYEALGAIDQSGLLIGGWIYDDYRQLPDGTHNIWISAAGSGNWLTRGNLRVFFGYPYNQLKCSRISALIAKGNHRSRNIVERLGFVQEGKFRGWFGPGKDGIVYSMLKNECKWIGENHEQRRQTENA